MLYRQIFPADSQYFCLVIPVSSIFCEMCPRISHVSFIRILKQYSLPTNNAENAESSHLFYWEERKGESDRRLVILDMYYMGASFLIG